ncbi:MAG: SpoIID/LytB domain-containing protein, partial [Mariniphaga sp.]
MKNEPKIEVGIMAQPQIEFLLNGEFNATDGLKLDAGSYSASIENSRVVISTSAGKIFSADTFYLAPQEKKFPFELKGVTIGVDFHWEQKENQQFQGALKLIPEDGNVRAINVIHLEDYLKSVISSEMSATSSPELLKAHAVISRSWLLAQIEKTKSLKADGGLHQTSHETDDEIIRWYDRED